MKYTAILAAIILASSAYAMPQFKNAPLGKSFAIGMDKGEPFPDFSLKDATGKDIKSEELRKGKVMVVRVARSNEIWKKHIDALNTLSKDNGEKVVFIDLVSGAMKEEDVIAEYKKLGCEYTVALDPKADTAIKMKINHSPITIIFDRNGKMYAAYMNFTADGLQKEIDKALGIK